MCCMRDCDSAQQVWCGIGVPYSVLGVPSFSLLSVGSKVNCVPKILHPCGVPWRVIFPVTLRSVWLSRNRRDL